MTSKYISNSPNHTAPSGLRTANLGGVGTFMKQRALGVALMVVGCGSDGSSTPDTDGPAGSTGTLPPSTTAQETDTSGSGSQTSPSSSGTTTGPETATDTSAETGPELPDETQTVTYQPDDTTDFINPERGWMERGSPDEFAGVREGDEDNPTGYSVVWTDVGDPVWDEGEGNPFRLDNYRTQDLPQDLLDAVDASFSQARDAGIKLKIRFMYNYSSDGEDTTLSWMQSHIGQLGPILSDNADTIASMDAGFVGRWGEMHSSSDIVEDVDDNDAVNAATAVMVESLLDATPPSVHVDVRYPRIVRAMFGERGYSMDLEERFSGSHQSRLGWFNDCLWSSRGNTGTYSGSNDDNGVFELDRDTFESVGRYAASSGESCSVGGLNEFNSCEAVLEDMVLIGGPDTLLRGYWSGMYERWIEEGCYDEVTRRIGYRLQLVSATLPVYAAAGVDLEVSLELRNTGFGKVHNARPLDLVFVSADHEATVRLTDDARRQLPLSGETTTSAWTVPAPDDLLEGHEYQLFLRLPDPSQRLQADDRYTLRLANEGEIWDARSGRHDLGMSVQTLAGD